MNDNYEDIINLPHHVSKQFPQMSMENRAAQFAPFAALSGHDEAIRETARLTEEQIDLDETSAMILNQQIALLRQKLKEKPLISVRYFKADSKKSGGYYKEFKARLKIIDEYTKCFVFCEGETIPMSSIVEISLEEE